MTGVLYPIAATPEAALHDPIGRAGLESVARRLAGADVAFVRELAGPAFETRDAALAAWRGRVDGDGVSLAMDDRYCELQAVRDSGARPPRTAWRLCVGYWRVAGAARPLPAEPARKLRRSKAGKGLDSDTVGAMAEQPLRPAAPQKALDIGLFEVRLPENPAVIIADE
jgi:hypothetical protein